LNGIAKKAFLIITAAATLAAAVGVLIVSLAYAEFAFAREYLTAAGAAAVVAGTAALILVVAALSLVIKSGWKKPVPEPTLGEKAAEFIKRKPIVAVAAALGGGFLALRNPALVATLVMSFLAPAPSKKR
jgi:Na+-transporting methylmalonyl-CoA/oxaloacetate decarboxylase gamma subunit